MASHNITSRSMTNEVEDNENDSQEDEATVDTEASTSVTLNIQVKGELTPEQQKLLIDIRRRKTELLLEIQATSIDVPWVTLCDTEGRIVYIQATSIDVPWVTLCDTEG
uniref:Uncharacterized protein n=1 Tax=Timema genevievae TaxID=629358 RepID=A0A7R9PPH9_TIMGE|nr:unnamed protein product [Timema genevievae]